MPVLIALLGALIAFYVIVIRAKRGAKAATDLLDAANEVRLAARRFGFRRRADVHPVDSIEDPNVAIAAICQGFLELDDLPTQDQRKSMLAKTQSSLGVSAKDAEELMVLGRWLMMECGSPSAAISRLSRKLFKLSGASALDPLLAIVKETVAAGSGLNQRHREALEDIKRAFRIT